jgi:ribose transport system permease protein
VRKFSGVAMQTEDSRATESSKDQAAPGWGVFRSPSEVLKLVGSARGLENPFERFAGLAFFIIMFVVLSLLLPGEFLTHTNVIAVVNTQVVTAIIALGLLAPLAAGVFDISVAGVMTLAVIVSTALFQGTNGSMPVIVSVLITLLVGAAAGVVNGALVVGVRIDPFIVTLGSSTVFVALSELISHDQVVADKIPSSFVKLSQDTWLGIPLPVFYTALLALVAWYVLSYTPLGRMIYATGSGRETARLSGLPTNRILYGCFITSGVCAAAAGVVFAAQTGSGQPDSGSSYLLPAYAAAFLGSTIIRPGRFNVPGLLIAIGILAFGLNGLQLDNAPTWVADGFPGAALIVAVVLSKIRTRTPR